MRLMDDVHRAVHITQQERIRGQGIGDVVGDELLEALGLNLERLRDIGTTTSRVGLIPYV
jgi:hypothetical protein